MSGVTFNFHINIFGADKTPKFNGLEKTRGRRSSAATNDGAKIKRTKSEPSQVATGAKSREEQYSHEVTHCDIRKAGRKGRRTKSDEDESPKVDDAEYKKY